jgi:hypothetical protein
MHTAVPHQRLGHLRRLILRTTAKQEGQQEKSTNNAQRKPVLSNKGQGRASANPAGPSLGRNTSAIKLIRVREPNAKAAARLSRFDLQEKNPKPLSLGFFLQRNEIASAKATSS